MGTERFYFFVALAPGNPGCDHVLMTTLSTTPEACLHLPHLPETSVEAAVSKLASVYGIISHQVPQPLGAVVYEWKAGSEVIKTLEAEVYLLPSWERISREKGMKVVEAFAVVNLPTTRREDQAWVERAVSGDPGFHFIIPMTLEPEVGSGGARLPVEIS